jgi:ATP-dependent DNA ligase
MLEAFEFCLPTAAKIAPAGPDWLHEVKYDGYRLRVERNGDRVRLITRVRPEGKGSNFAHRFAEMRESGVRGVLIYARKPSSNVSFPQWFR